MWKAAAAIGTESVSPPPADTLDEIADQS